MAIKARHKGRFLPHVALGILLTVLAAAALIFSLWQAGWFHGRVREAIVKYTSRYTRTECRVDRVEGALLTGLDIYGFAIANGPSFERDGAALVIDEIHVSYNPYNFIRKKVLIDTVRVVRPRLVLKRDADGRVNLARIFGPKGPPRGKGVFFHIENVILEDAYFKMHLGSPLSEFSHANIACAFTKARGAVFIDLRHCSAYLPEFGQFVPHFGSGMLAINARRMHFSSVDVASRTTEITTYGTIRFEPEVYLDLKFRADPLDLGEVGQGVFKDPPPFYGRARYSGSITGPVGHLVQSGVLAMDAGYLYTHRLEDIIVYYDMDLAARRIEVGGFTGRLNGTPVTLEMALDFSGPKPAYWGEGKLLSVDLSRYVEDAFLKSAVDCKVAFAGTGLRADDYALEVAATFGAGRLGPVTIDEGGAIFRYARGRADITALGLRVGEGEVYVRGAGDARVMDFDLEINDLPLTRVNWGKRKAPAEGLVTFRGHVWGPHSRPSLEGSLVVEDLRRGPLVVGSALVEGEWLDLGGNDNISAHVIVWDTRLGPLVVARAYGDVTAAGGDLAVTDGYLGTANGAEASFAFRWDQRGDRLALERLDLKLSRGDARLTAPLTATRKGDRYELGGGVLQYGEGALSVAGTYAPASGTLRGVVEARRMPIEDFVLPNEAVRVTGTLMYLRLDVAGVVSSPSLYATLAASNLNVNGQPIDFVHGEASYEEGRLVIPGVTAGLGGGTVEAQAFIPIKSFSRGRPETLDATIWFSRFKISTFNAFYKRGVADDGFVEGVITATGTAASPEIRGNLLLNDVRRGELAFAKGRADFVFADGVVSVREVSLSQRDLPNVMVQGKFPVPAFFKDKPMPPVDARGDFVDLDLRLVNLFTDDILVTAGKIRGSVTVVGNYDKPALFGMVAVVDGGGFVRALNSTVRNLYGAVEAAGNVLTVDAENPLSFQLDEGRGRAWGSVSLEMFKISALNISTEINGYVVRALGNVQARGDIALRLTGKADHLFADAEMKVTGGLITIPFGGGEPTPAVAAASQLDYEVRINAPGNLWLRNEAADIELEADVTARRISGNTFYTGELKAKRGYYYFLQRDFEVERAEITLTGTTALNPVLNIRGRRLIRALDPALADATVYIDVTGTLREPAITLSYETTPPASLSQDEILMVLALDVTWADINQGMSAGALATKESADYVQRYAAAEVARAVRRGTGLEVFRFESNLLSRELELTPEPEEGYAEVTVGQHLTPELFVSYTGKYKEDAWAQTSAVTHAAEVDYALTRDLYVVGSTADDDGVQRYGFGLRFVKKY